MKREVYIPNRLNWIDWAKVIAISLVVFGHIPQVPGSFPQSYIVILHMPLFFFISGYLTKKEVINIETLKKYWHTLVIPYFCYNLLFYPYWIARHYIEVPNGGFYSYIKPLLGTIMLQGNSLYYEPLNGVTWFVASLIGYKLILSICNRYKKGYILILVLIVFSSIVYIHNQFYLYIRDLTPVGFLKCFPFYFIGYYCKHMGYISTNVHKYDWGLGVLCIGLSIGIFFIERNVDNMLMYGIRYWLVSLFAIMGVIGICKYLDRIHSSVIDNLSIGTIVIMGFHFILIGSTNYILEHLLHLEGRIIYNWWVACFLVVIFEAMIYPLIIIFKNKAVFLLGKRRQ